MRDFHHHQFATMSRAVLLSVLLIALSACAPSRIMDPDVTPSDHLQRASAMMEHYKYAEAQQEIEQALLKSPKDPSIYLFYGELLEILNRPEEAAEHYLLGLRHLDSRDALFIELSHRVGLVEALKLNNTQQASERLFDLPEDSIEHIDLQGAIALQQGRFREALLILSHAPNVTRFSEKIAWVRYHAALAYNGLGDQRNSRSSLYFAVNFAQSPVLKRDIAEFWQQIKQSH